MKIGRGGDRNGSRGGRSLTCIASFTLPCGHGYVLILLRLRDVTLEATGPKEAAELLEDLGVELDSPEHAQLERSCLCTRAPGSRN